LHRTRIEQLTKYKEYAPKDHGGMRRNDTHGTSDAQPLASYSTKSKHELADIRSAKSSQSSFTSGREVLNSKKQSMSLTGTFNAKKCHIALQQTLGDSTIQS